MPQAEWATRRLERRWPWFALATMAFGTSYSLAPLYTSNQNHHFLKGIARAGEGWLRDDWLAGTVDPFPVFTAFVTIVHRFLTDTLYYPLYYLLLGAYAYGLMAIVEHVWPPRNETRHAERLLFLAALCVLHNEVIAYLLGIDLRHLPWWQMTHWGVAEQELFGHGMFQPSAVGLLLPLAIAWALEGRPMRATMLMGAVLLVHFSYVVTVAALTVSLMILDWRRDHWRRPLAIAATALLFAAPALAYALSRFGPTTPDMWRRAASILVQHIPQEADPSVWLGAKAWLQFVLMIAGVMLAAGTDLFVMLLSPLVAGVMLTSAAITSRSPQLELLFPWRVSVLLVPISTALIVQYLIHRSQTWAIWTAPAGRRRIVIGTSVVVIVSMLAGAVRMTLNFAYFHDYRPITARLEHVVPVRWRADFAQALRPDTLPMMAFVGGAVSRGDLYLIPPELERFRLETGAPVLVDFKSHPYEDREVLEWFARLQLAEAFYQTGGDCAVLDTIEEHYAVTHVVFDERVRPARCSGLVPIYSDRVFDVFRVRRAADVKINSSECCKPLALADPLQRGSSSSSAFCWRCR